MLLGYAAPSGRLVKAQTDADQAAETPTKNSDRDAFFGDLHMHTSWSIDAYVFGTHDAGPYEAIMFAQGEPVRHPGGFMVQLKRPLDFMILMDHSEYTGALSLANDPKSAFSKTPRGKELKAGTEANAMKLYGQLSASMVRGERDNELQGSDVAGYSWRKICDFADAATTPGKFTAFPGWEWTSTPNNRNLHRNVLFKDAKRVSQEEFSSLESMSPEDLWKWMDGQRAAGNDVMAITHNGNLSDGALYPRERTNAGQPIDRAYAETRMRHEPLAEISQVKGQSETTPLLSPDDEFADFNVFVWLLLGAQGTTTDYGSYMRLALRDGIAMQGAYGFNPYKFGFNGASDAHSAMSSYRADDYFGQHSRFDDTPEKRLSPIKTLNMDNRTVCTAGLTGVWADENSRDAIWSAFQRKETYATSGPRLKVRLFAGWDFNSDVLQNDDWVKTAYAQGVPMGGDLVAYASSVPAKKPRPAGNSTNEARSPSFIVSASKDPDGANLDRIQIVKGWAKYGQSFERVYDVAWSGDRQPDAKTGKVPAVGNTVDISKGTYTDTIGATELEAVWTDPDFDPSLDAFYYARVLQIPTPRWTTVEAAKQGVIPPDVVPLTLQDRAWSSPIWYTPNAEARKSGKPGVTVAELQNNGAVALDDSQLKSLVVGKTLNIHNTVTGQRVQLLFGDDGHPLILAVDGKTPDQSLLDNPLHSAAQYEIRDGVLITVLNGTPFRVTVYKLGDKHVAARSYEFGHANYELE
ncbi:MAG: DUF3604 domain-containing protein [Planctomycetota bacterium]|nr:DUF3604 domain-containing protein [Planctomycetota bacterium]